MRTLVHLPYRFASLYLDQQLTPRTAWTVLAGAISSEGGDVETKCAPLQTFLRAAAVEGSAIPFATADLEVVALDKAPEAQRMEIIQRDLPARFNTGSSGGPLPGGAMTLALTTFKARTDMIKRTCVVSNASPKALRAKTPEERWGAVLEGALCIHGCVDASGLPPVYATLAATPKGGRGPRCRFSIRPARMRKARRRPFRPSASPPPKTCSWHAETMT